MREVYGGGHLVGRIGLELAEGLDVVLDVPPRGLGERRERLRHRREDRLADVLEEALLRLRDARRRAVHERRHLQSEWGWRMSMST